MHHSNKLGIIADAVPVLVTIAEANYSEQPKQNEYEFKPNEELAHKLKNLLSDLLRKLKEDKKLNETEEDSALTISANFFTC